MVKETLARQVSVEHLRVGRMKVTYRDLAQLAGGQYAMIDPLLSPSHPGYVVEALSEGEAMERLQQWPDEQRARRDGSMSTLTREGRRWLRQASAQERGEGVEV